MAGAALALGLALTGCGQQALVGEAALDPEAPQLTAEEARQEASRLQEEGVGHGAEEAGGGGESHSETGSGGGGESHSETGSESGTASGGGSEPSEAEANAGSDEGSASTESGGGSASTGTGGGGSGSGQITDQALAQFQQQFPAISAVASEQQLRSTATQVCSAIASGGTAAGQQVVETLPGVTGTTAQQVVGFFDREVCPR